MRSSRFALAALVAGCGFADIAGAQSINIDFGFEGSSPSSAFGGPASSPGFWNTIEGGFEPSYALRDLSGNITGATVESTLFFNGSTNNPRPETAGNPEHAALLDDFIYCNADTQGELLFLGLEDGEYDLTVTAILVGRPDQPTQVTWLSNDFGEFLDDITGDGAYSGDWELGVTHATFRVPVVNGELHVFANGIFNFETESFGNLNGLQLVRVPAPGSLALLASGSLLALRRRRHA